MAAAIGRKIRAREHYKSLGVSNGERGRPLSGRKGGGDPGRRRLRDDPWHRFPNLSRGSVTIRGERWTEQSRDRPGRYPFPGRREICAVRFTSPARPQQIYILLGSVG